MHFAPPGVPVFSALTISSLMLPKLALLFGITTVLFLIPHAIAATVLAPERTAARIVAATLLHVFGICLSFVAHAFAFAFLGPSGLTLSGILIFIVFAYAIAAIYQFSFGRALLYNLLVGVFAAAMGWTADKVLFSEKGLVAYFFRSPSDREESREEIAQSPPGPAPRFATVQQAQSA